MNERVNDARYELVLLDDSDTRFPLIGSITIGRHLDNDIVIAGEDVRDFHVRVETTQRGPRVIALDGATAHRNATAIDGSAGLRPGDELVLGRHRLRVDVATAEPPCHWRLQRIGDDGGLAIERQATVGRAGDCALQLADDHISRHHARVAVECGTVWLEDLGSANGTFINGARLIGAARLFHGDEVAFDTVRYQLIGDAPDLTPLRPFGQPPDQLEAPAAMLDQHRTDAPTETTVTATAQGDVAHAARKAAADSRQTPPMLVGASPPVEGREFPLRFGRHLIGRAADADIALVESSVSLRHAELELQPDGARLVNLMSTNGTWVNGVEAHTTQLRDGDVLRFGRVTLEFHAARSGAPRPPRHRWIVGIAGGIVALLLLLWWSLH